MGAAVVVAGKGSSFHISEEKIHENYSMEYQIGKGGFSDVFLATDKFHKKKVAMKRISLSSALSQTRGLNALTNELQVYQQIGCHKNIVSLHSAYRLQNHFYFVMDALLGGDLRQYLQQNGKISQRAISYVIACLGSGLHHMHQRGIIHRDVKPENIVLDSKGTPYLTDLGISHLATENCSSSLVCCESSGTLHYLAPEVLTRTHEHSYQSDFWSLGIMTYELLTGQRPYDPHVPIHFIAFVANHYQALWDHPLQGTSSAPITDSQPHLPFPNYRLTFNEDGSVPHSLIAIVPSTRLPSRSSLDSPESVGQEMIELVKGLLDVRITMRLGSMDRFEEFTHHSAFIKLGDHSSHDSSPSPLMDEDRSRVLSGGPPKRSFVQYDEDPLLRSFDESIEAELDKLFYVRDHEGDHRDLDFILPTQISKFSESTTQRSLMTSARRSRRLPFCWGQ
jgi:serine/threonine protein kinase